MNLDVVRNAKRNLIFGVISRVIAVSCPFITKTVIQYTLGEHYLGLGSLFSAILSVLSMAELGFSSAIVYSMYKPVAEGRTDIVNSLLNFYRKVYACVGMAVLAVGLSILPFLPRFIKGAYPTDISLTVLYLIYLGNAVISYFMFAYMSSLIVVYQRDDVNSRTNVLVTLLLTVTQIIILTRFRNYLLFSLMMPVFTVLNNIRIAYIVKKMFPQYHCEGKIPETILADMKKQIAGTVVQRICAVARNSFDSICTSAFIGLTMTAKYNNYYSIIAALTSFMQIFQSSITGGIGNHAVIKSEDENYQELKELDFVYMWISGWCTICLFCLTQPFMRLWMGDRMMLSDAALMLFCIYFYVLKIGDMRSIYTNARGLWWQHRWRSIFEAVGNITLNFLLTKYFGIYGIISATIITLLLINTIWGGRIVFRHYFGLKHIGDYFKYQAGYAAVTAVLCFVTWNICEMLPVKAGVFVLPARGIICVIVPNLFYILIYRRLSYFHKLKEVLLRK